MYDKKWVQTLRDKKILRPVHVDTKYNAADLFTKILGKQDFQRLRDMLMKQLPSIWGGDLKYGPTLAPPCGTHHISQFTAAPLATWEFSLYAARRWLHLKVICSHKNRPIRPIDKPKLLFLAQIETWYNRTLAKIRNSINLLDSRYDVRICLKSISWPVNHP